MVRSMLSLHHELISASAGSGKTFQLVRRYLHLLALGVEPESIVAMTFTRKAAGEFFSRILTRLAALAAGQVDARSYFADLSPPVPAETDYAALLRRLTRRMHRLRLGTLDSFFASIATCFPLELGLSANAAVMDEAEAAQMQKQTLEALLDELHTEAEEETTRLLLESVKRASFGHEEKRTEETLRKWVAENHELWCESLGMAAWANPAAIWGAAFLTAEAATSTAMMEALQELRDALPPMTDGGLKKFDALAEELPLVRVTEKPPATVSYFLGRTAAMRVGLSQGTAELDWYKNKVVLTGPAVTAWQRLSGLLLRRELLARAHRTAGLAAFLERYEQRYQRQVRGQGHLSFADIPRLIRQRAEDEQTRWPQEDLWFRLDGRFDHWMLDEFQDTSYQQWRVTQRLVDEVIQDQEGDRSFFAVGDIKQSIYVWRNAEPRLFNELKRLRPVEKGRPGGIHVSTLAKSYRSAQPVLDAVNAVFADTAALEALLPGSTREWEFTAHQAANRELTGGVRFYSTLTEDKNAGKDEEDTEGGAAAGGTSAQRAVAALIREINPLARGLSCAVLVRSNDKASTMTAALRALTGMKVVTDSKIHPVTDNAVTLAFLSLLQLAAHPADTLALEHLRMTPLGALLGGTREALWRAGVDCARTLFEKGFAAWVLALLDTMTEKGLALDAFHQRRVEHLLDFAGGFDEEGNRDIDLFIKGARDCTVSQTGAGESIQVMTTHKSKGLEFDVVILPDLSGDAMDLVKKRTWLVKRERGDTQWVLQSPEKTYVPVDEVLSDEARESREKQSFESLCRLYVAMTRAKRGLYFIAGPPPAKPTALKEELFLRRRLCGQAGGSGGVEVTVSGEPLRLEWETGDAGWFLASKAPQPVVEALAVTVSEGRALGDLIHQNQPSQRRRTPSGEESFKVPGRVLFSPGRDAGRHLGTRVHELMAEVAWWQPGQPLEPLLQHWQARGLLVPGELISEQALALVRPLLESAVGQETLCQPGPDAVLWREKPFDFIDSGDWVSGVFDRVVLERDAAGRFVRGQILDFKTDETADDAALQEKAAGYAPQLALYRRAVARLTGLAETEIRTSLVFLRALRVVAVEGKAA